MKTARTIIAIASIMLACIGSASAQMSAAQTWVPAANIGGTGIAVTLSVPNVNQLADLLGVPIRFIPVNNNNTNFAGSTTIAVSGLSAQPVRRVAGASVVAIAGGDLSPSALAEVIWDGTEFILTNPATGNDPVGTEREFTGPTVPNGWLIENGVCVSQTTYATLWNYYGASDIWSPGSTGGACTAGNFHLPFANGRTSAAADNQGSVTASVLTNAGSGCAATAPAVLCGAQNRTVGQANLPNVNFNVTDPGHTHTSTTMNSTPGTFSVGGLTVLLSGTGGTTTGGTTDSHTTGITVGSGGSGTALATITPTYTVLKAVKY